MQHKQQQRYPLPVHLHGASGFLLDPSGLAARSDPPVAPPGPLGVPPGPPAVPLGPTGVSWLLDRSPVCPPVPLVSLFTPPRVLQCTWCLFLGPTVA